MQTVRHKVQPHQLVGQGGGGEFCIAEHNGPLVAPADEQLRQVGQLVAAGGAQHVLGDPGLAVQHRLHRDLGRVFLIQPADVHHLAADGGAEHRKALAGLHRVNDLAHILVKAHVQHFVRLVQHDVLHRAHVDGAVLHVVHQAARGGHHDLAAPLELVDLLLHVGAAVHAGNAHLGQKVAQVLQVLGDLLRQFPGGRQDHRLGRLAAAVHPLNDGDAESAGLAGAGGRLGDHVLPRQHHRNGLFLHLGHVGKAHALHRLQNFRAHAP